MSSNVAHDVQIRRARVHVVRRGGWSWGPDAQALVNSVKSALPALLSHIIERSVPQSVEDTEITTPVTVRVSLRLADLQQLAAHVSAGDSSEVEETIVRAIARSSNIENVVHAIGTAAAAGRDISPALTVADDHRHPDEPAVTTISDHSARPLLAMLRQWDRDGELAQRCSTLPSALLRQWVDHLRTQWPTANLSTPAPIDAELDATAEQAQREHLLLPAGEHATLVRCLILAVRLFALGAHRSQVQLLLVGAKPQPLTFESAAPLIGKDAESESVLDPSPPATDRSTANIAPYAIASRGTASRDFQIDVPNALPFLLLGPLSRIGYLDALQVAFNIAGGTHSVAIATALAYKALQVPQRGWYREAAQRHAAAALAGRADILEDQEIAAAVYALRTHAPLFDQLIAANLIQGHRAEAPWLLCADERDSFILFDSDGLFPVAIDAPEALAASIAPSGSPLYVSRTVAVTSVFETLDGLQIPYVARGSAGTSSLRISSYGPHHGRMRAFAEHGEDRCDRAMTVWRAIRFERPLLRQSVEPAMETSLTLAASLALGTIAWTLWRAREATDPLLTIERFGDLDARIQATATTIHVRLPLGRRFWDLRDHGLLADVRDVPWLDGRTVTFGAG